MSSFKSFFQSFARTSPLALSATCALAFVSACASTPSAHSSTLASHTASYVSSELSEPGPRVVEGHGHIDATHVGLSLIAEPSERAATSLPVGARYHVAAASPESVALAFVSADARVLGRLAVRLDEDATSPLGGSGLVLEHETPDGRRVVIEARTRGDRIEGRVHLDGEAASWRVRLSSTGELDGERWSARGRSSDTDLELLRATASITADLGELVDASVHASIDELSPELDACSLAELTHLAQIATELSVRAWLGQDRAQLPSVTGPEGC